MRTLVRTVMKRNVYILGSGFSASFGFPTQANLFSKLMAARERSGETDKAKIVDALQFLYPHFNKESPVYPPFEEFLSLVEIIRDFKEGFSREQLQEAKNAPLRLLTDLFSQLAEQSIVSENAALLHEFVQMPSSGDVIITFNWDCLLERAYSQLERTPSLRGRIDDGVAILKLHGSLSWGRTPSEKGQSKPNSATWLTRDHEDIFVVKDHKYGDFWDLMNEGPLIIPPIMTKRPFEYPSLERIWYEALCSLMEAKQVFIIGYSLPLEDFHARTLLLSGISHLNSKILLIDPNPAVAGRYFSLISPRVEYFQGYFSEPALRAIRQRVSRT